MQKSFDFDIVVSSFYPLGVFFVPDGLHISAVFEKKEICGIILYDRAHREGIRIPFPEDCRRGDVYSMLLKGYHDRNCSYLFFQGEQFYQDPYATALAYDGKYGVQRTDGPCRCRVSDSNYDWENDRPLRIPFEESIFYQLHVRGFTKHKSSGVRHKGTYAGAVEKIPYLKELGITAIVLMPSYEFDEILAEVPALPTMEKALSGYWEPIAEQGEKKLRINYWGYQDGLYFMPKYAYAYEEDAVREFKDMVKAFHQNGMEVLMQFFFPPAFDFVKMLRILKFWVLEYHIDGFHLMGADIPIHIFRNDPLFTETKLLSDKDDFSGTQEYTQMPGEPAQDAFCNFGLMNEAFLYDMRKLLKGDVGMIPSLIYHSRENAAEKGIINYIARQDGFRLYDLVSYNAKHNEANGEKNQDGTSYNYSWNCGVEGKTRKKTVRALRMRQMKNGMTFVLLSQGTPLLYSGDEFGNTQEGNNNPYCQDNPTGWIKWNQLEANKELFTYTKELIRLRKANPILHAKMPLRGVDYISCGYPNISFHGKEAWQPDTGAESRSLGILYCCRYEKKPIETESAFFYIGINMHWEPYRFGLPKMPKDREWIPLMSTGTEAETDAGMKDESGQPITRSCQELLVPPRTIVIYGTRAAASKKERVNSQTEKGHNYKKKEGGKS